MTPRARQPALPRSLVGLAWSLSPKVVIALAAFSLVVNLTMLAAPLYMLQVYDRVLASGSVPTLVLLTLATLAVMGAAAGLELFRSEILTRLGLRFDMAWSERLLRQLLAEAGGRRPQAPGQPLRDVETVRGLLGGQAPIACLDAPWAPLFLVVLFALHPLLGILGLAASFGLAAIAAGTEMATAGPVRESSTRSIAAHRIVQSAERNAGVVMAMGMLEGVLKRWREAHDGALVAHGGAGDRRAVFRGLTKFVRPAFQTGVLGLGAFLAVRAEISPGSIVAASIVLGRALAPIEQGVGSWREFVLARQAYQRLKDAARAIAEGPPERLKLPAPKGRLSVEDVSVVAREGVPPVLDRIAFTVAPGEVLALMGPSGAGKTTLLKILAGIWTPSRGSARLDEAELCHWDAGQLGRHVGYLPQEIGLFDVTVAENICRLGHADPQAIVDAARLAGAHEMILRLPEGYGTRAGEGGSQLSAGQRQRVGLARAFYGNPSVVLLDEPNAHLDAAGEEALRRAIVDLKAKGTTFVIAMHGKGLLAVTDRVLTLDNGRMEGILARAQASDTLPPQMRRSRKIVELNNARLARRAGKASA
ncbi:MAG: type I secretion system permease/ATPase [Alphaproteobacteria bacterium]|nr:type I secretion system permease/ATPase [Alphaproteobacteria bacterium]